MTMGPAMLPYRGRSIDPARPVRAYPHRRLRGGDGYSFAIMQGGIVVAHTDCVVLREVRPVVSRAGAGLEGMIGYWPDGASHSDRWDFSKYDAAFFDVTGRFLVHAQAAMIRSDDITTTGTFATGASQAVLAQPTEHPMGTDSVICVSDAYTTATDSFASVQEFLDMCQTVFGLAPTLTYRPGMARPGWYDADGDLVLVAANNGASP